MSIDLDVFIERSKLPSLSEWQEAISRAGFSLTFPEPVSLAKHTGYLPAVLGNEESGFEFFVSNWDQAEELPDDVRSLAPAANASVNFSFHEMHECHTATVAAAVLASLANGVFFDPQSGVCLDGREAIAQAKAQLDAAAKKEAEEVARHGKLPPDKWARAFEQTLHQVNPDYRLSKDHRGRSVECLREGVTGLRLSQNCIKMYDRYRHCFGVLLTDIELSGALSSPLVLGSRFDHNATIASAYNRDYREGMKWQVAPQEWHSEYRDTVRGTQQWVETTARSAEQYLFPLYLGRLSRGADRVISLYQDAVVFLEQWGVSEETLAKPIDESTLSAEFAANFHLESEPSDWNGGLVTFFNALRLADSHGFSGTDLLKHQQDAIVACDDIALARNGFALIPDHIRNAAIFARYIEDFLAVRDELPRMIQIVENVKSLRAQLDGPPSGQERRWWQFWK